MVSEPFVVNQAIVALLAEGVDRNLIGLGPLTL